MLIPKYWAHHKQRFDAKADDSNAKKQATIERYGWSKVSQAEALIHAKQRVDEAHSHLLAGKDILLCESDEQHNDSNIMPIREQIISERNFRENGLTTLAPNIQLIITRNSSGAQVANVNNIAIIDVDNIDLLRHLYPDDHDNEGCIDTTLAQATSTHSSMLANDNTIANNPRKPTMKPQVWGFVIAAILIASVIAWQSLSWAWLIIPMLAGTATLWRQASEKERIQQAETQKIADRFATLLPFVIDLIQKRVTTHANERFRLYETPAGFRLIATHATVAPSDSIVKDWLTYFHADTSYARLCEVQQCFRARLTAKPWRMTEVDENKLAKQIPANDFWFIDANTNDVSFEAMDEEEYDNFEKRQVELAARQQWIVDYDHFAKGYKACRYVESFSGKEFVDSKSAQTVINEFVAWHDSACQVDKELPIA